VTIAKIRPMNPTTEAKVINPVLQVSGLPESNPTPK